jgi:tetratricopeptide (TPR) repeat protein
MLPHAVHTHRHATVPAAPGLAPDGAAAQRIEARHGHAIGALTEALAEHRLAWHAAREDGDFGRILQSELRYAEAAAAIADALRSRGEPDDAVEAYLKAKRREIDTWAPFALPSLRRWGVFARGARPIPRR